MENKFLYINAREISELLSIDDCINVMSDALTAYSGGNVVKFYFILFI
jgi:hypothetical protein